MAMRNPIRLSWVFLLLLFLVVGCAASHVHQWVADFQRPPQYEQFFALLDRAVDQAGVRDASSFQVPGFAYLRTSRFLTSFKDRLDTDDARKQWIEAMRQLDLAARKKEIRNLPPDALKALASELGQPADRQLFQDQMTRFSARMLAHDRQQPDYYRLVQLIVSTPDEYRTIYRVLGLYPLTSIPVASLTYRAQAKFEKWHRTPADRLPQQGRLTAYRPSDFISYSQTKASEIIRRSSRNPLEVPILAAADEKILLAMFAPVIVQDIVRDYDRIGAVVWEDNRLGIDFQQPTVYCYLSHARLKGHPVLQLNYVFWYAARNGENSPAIERGRLDGLTVRISLDPKGLPFMVDIMNNCGCYHFFVPDRQRVLGVISIDQQIDAFVPRWLPELFPAKRLVIRVISGWHQVNHLGTDEGLIAASLPYRLTPYDQLEMLPRPGGGSESIFSPRGIAKGSERIEPLLLFSMGIPDIGAMRQRGHHAVKLLGRSHFDDPDLFEDNFEIK